jgi:hypothetical protein
MYWTTTGLTESILPAATRQMWCRAESRKAPETSLVRGRLPTPIQKSRLARRKQLSNPEKPRLPPPAAVLKAFMSGTS